MAAALGCPGPLLWPPGVLPAWARSSPPPVWTSTRLRMAFNFPMTEEDDFVTRENRENQKPASSNGLLGTLRAHAWPEADLLARTRTSRCLGRHTAVTDGAEPCLDVMLCRKGKGEVCRGCGQRLSGFRNLNAQNPGSEGARESYRLCSARWRLLPTAASVVSRLLGNPCPSSLLRALPLLGTLGGLRLQNPLDAKP